MSLVAETDLPPNLPCLKNLDTLLRCPICFDFLNISMMTRCSHNFCSLCIRKFLSYKLLCPVCNTPLTEQELRNNRIVDDLVQSFHSVRQQLSRTNFESPPISPKTPSLTVKGKASRQKALKKEGNTLTQFFQKRAPVSPSPQAQTADALHPIKQEPMETSVQEVQKEKLDDAFPSTSQDVKPIIKVDCPVCGVEIPQQHINKHLDTCLTRDEKKESLRRSDQLGSASPAFVQPNSQKRKPMVKLVYALLTISELKRRLKECHLSTQGSREQLIKRHQEFTHIYNAQCDALHPRTSEDIAKEVEDNEKARKELGNKTKPALTITKHHTCEEIEQLHADYRKQHTKEFSRLIAEVRGRLETKRTRIKQEEGKSAKMARCTADPAIQNKIQPAVSMTFQEKTFDTEVVSRSQSPTPSEVSASSSLSDVFT